LREPEEYRGPENINKILCEKLFPEFVKILPLDEPSSTDDAGATSSSEVTSVVALSLPSHAGGTETVSVNSGTCTLFCHDRFLAGPACLLAFLWLDGATFEHFALPCSGLKHFVH
jgi:hypothetical protein